MIERHRVVLVIFALLLKFVVEFVLMIESSKYIYLPNMLNSLLTAIIFFIASDFVWFIICCAIVLSFHNKCQYFGGSYNMAPCASNPSLLFWSSCRYDGSDSKLPRSNKFADPGGKITNTHRAALYAYAMIYDWFAMHIYVLHIFPHAYSS